MKSKLCGETLDLIMVNNPEGWTECKRILISRYSDASSEKLYYLINSVFVTKKQTNRLKITQTK